jgi:hypothetical protein
MRDARDGYRSGRRGAHQDWSERLHQQADRPGLRSGALHVYAEFATRQTFAREVAERLRMLGVALYSSAADRGNSTSNRGKLRREPSRTSLSPYSDELDLAAECDGER